MKSPYWVLDLGGSQAFKGLGAQLVSCIETITGNPPIKVTLQFDELDSQANLKGGDIESLNDLSSLVSRQNSNQSQPIRGVFAVLSNVQSQNLSLLCNQARSVGASSCNVKETDADRSIPLEFAPGDSLFWDTFLALLSRADVVSRAILFSLANVDASVFDKEFDIVKLGDSDRVSDYMLSRIGRDMYNFSPRVNERDNNRFLSKQDATGTLPPYGRNLLKSEYNDWFRQEFGDFATAQAFLRCCWGPLCQLPLPEEGTQPNRSILPWPAQIAIGVTRMCRRMSTWTLEGNPFECTVVLVRQATVDVLKDHGSRFRSLIELHTPCPFNFDHEDNVRQYAEMAQGMPLIMAVSATDGKLHHIATSVRQDHSGLSHRYFSDLAGDHGIAFRIRPPAKVDVFSRDGLVLSYDGFHWKEKPFDALVEASARHFSKRKDIQRQCVDRIVEATQRLLDSAQSSIFIFVSEDDRKTALDLTGESLRPSVMWPSRSRIKVSEVEPGVLAATLHLDGAHLIDEDGEVFAIARRIRARRNARHRITLTKEEYSAILQYQHCLPCGGSVDRLHADQMGRYGELVFPRRLSISWINDWTKSLECIGDSVSERIDEELKRELTPLHTVFFKDDDPSVFSLDELRSQLQEVGIDGLLLRLHGKIGLVILKPFPSLDTVETHDGLRGRLSEQCGISQRGEFELATEWFVDRRIPQASEGYSAVPKVEGVAISPSGRVLVVESVLHAVMGNENIGFGLYQELFNWDQHGDERKDTSPGTGSRAAQEIHMRLPTSTVVKVSASGKLTVKFGKDLVAADRQI